MEKYWLRDKYKYISPEYITKFTEIQLSHEYSGKFTEIQLSKNLNLGKAAWAATFISLEFTSRKAPSQPLRFMLLPEKIEDKG